MKKHCWPGLRRLVLGKVILQKTNAHSWICRLVSGYRANQAIRQSYSHTRHLARRAADVSKELAAEEAAYPWASDSDELQTTPSAFIAAGIDLEDQHQENGRARDFSLECPLVPVSHLAKYDDSYQHTSLASKLQLTPTSLLA